METIWLLLVALAVGFILFLVVFNIGLKIPPAKPRWNPGESTPLQTIALPDKLPVPVARYFSEYFGRTLPVPETVIASGVGRFRVGEYPRILPFLGGKDIWAPIAWTIFLKPGEAFVLRSRIQWFRRSILMGGDELREGVGRFEMGDKALDGENLDNSQHTVLWLYTLYLAPMYLLTLPGLEWEQVDERFWRFTVPYKDEIKEFSIRFDERSGEMVRVNTSRSGSRSGEKYPFHVIFDRYRLFDDKYRLAQVMGMSWDEGEYVSYQLENIAYNADITAAMEEGISGG